MSVVLEVGAQVITSEDLGPLLAQYQMLPQLAREVILERAIAEIECTDEEKTLAHNQFCQQYQLSTATDIQDWMRKQGLTSAQLENLIVRRIKLEKFKEATWENEVEAYFHKRKSQLDRVVYSLIRTDKAEIAQELYFRIQEKETSFKDLAIQYSQGSEAQTGGLIGPVELSAPHPKIAQILSTSKPGQVSPPTRVGDWLVIVRLDNYISADLDQSMRQRLIEEMFRNWLNEQMSQNVVFFPEREDQTQLADSPAPEQTAKSSLSEDDSATQEKTKSVGGTFSEGVVSSS
jgi:parvulin-like peptidyl-prolyl isomerase